MKKNLTLIIILFLTLLFMLPHIEFTLGNHFYAFRYSDDISEFEDEIALNEAYFYYEKENISISSFSVHNFLFFNVFVMDYIEGNYCDSEFLLEEEYIHAFLERAEIKYNNADIDLKSLIQNKKAIVGNTRYLGNPYDKQIDYILDGRYETLFIFYLEELLVIQVGMSDEGPKFIAYK